MTRGRVTRTLVDRMEADEERLSEIFADRSIQLEDELGDRPLGTELRSGELYVAKFGPMWHVYGNAEPEIAGGYWDGWLGLGPDYDTGETDPDAGPRLALQHSARMYHLSREYPLVLARALMDNAELWSTYQALVAAGLHLGRIKPPLEEYWTPGSTPPISLALTAPQKPAQPPPGQEPAAPGPPGLPPPMPQPPAAAPPGAMNG